MARNATGESAGFLRGISYLLHDRDVTLCAAFVEYCERVARSHSLFRREVRS